eukprot:CAMPEP_0172667094 /NCGR_PEP_ID=MMETSP1074-20121228/8210_1 /TAXON_ID=2916 /ORGANISM="Ceratium fusus, Strain PA161109" /LENGTH=691 /DNA_ID=CAMNT_0013483557 /DNA_START=42 /DNA_END=2117 /DNA_ORIENTATION=+
MARRSVVWFLLLLGHAGSVSLNPIEQTVALLTQLQASIVKDGEAEAEAYRKFSEWCSTAAHDRNHEIKSAKRQKDKLEREVELATSDISEADEAIEELAQALSSDQARLSNAADVRKSERADFEKDEKSLLATIEMLDKASRVLQKQMKANSRISFMQSQAYATKVDDILQGLTAVIDAAGLPTEDTQALASFLQDRQADSDKIHNAADQPAYKSRSGNILKVLEDMREKSETLLRKSRQSERNMQHNFELVKAELTDLMTNTDKELQGKKGEKAALQKEKAGDTGDLAMIVKELQETTEALHSTQTKCMAKAADHEQSIKTRAEELRVLTQAKSTIQATMGSAEKRTYSFVQVTAKTQTRDRDGTVVSLLKRFARQQHSTQLAQLASRISALTKYGQATGEDPFKKVKGLIKDMIYKLKKEFRTNKGYCDEMLRSKERKEELSDLVGDLKAKIDKLISASAKAKSDVKDLQVELADLSNMQQEMDEAREAEHKAFVEAKEDLQQGLSGCRTALRVLRDYYSADDENDDAALLQNKATSEDAGQQPEPDAPHSKASGAGSGLIGLLEVVESDLAKNLAELESNEDTSKVEYDKLTQENRVTKIQRDKDVEYRTSKFKALDKSGAEILSDKSVAEEELAAVTQYYEKTKNLCTPKEDDFAVRKKKRLEKIAALEQALAILMDEGSLLEVHPH